MEVKAEIVHRLNHIFRKKPSKKTILLKENENLLGEIERQKKLISQLENALMEANSKLAEEGDKCYEEGFKNGMNMVEAEEKGVMEEFEILKNIEFLLKGNVMDN